MAVSHQAYDKDLAARKQRIIDSIAEKLRLHFGRTFEEASETQLYQAVALTVRDAIMERWTASRRARVQQQLKRVYYLSVEFLVGRSLTNNIINLLQDDAYRAALRELNVDLSQLEEVEPEAALGNGGLGRLAACFMDSLATLALPAMGCGIRYEYGLFKQYIIGGAQVEQPDVWLEDGNIWEVPTWDDQMEVRFGGRVVEDWSQGYLNIRYEDTTTVQAVPYDMPIIGYDSDVALSLRLWSAKSPTRIDMASFSRGEYAKAMEQKELAEVISKVLYPEDNHREGKMLRLKQHYFFTSATVQYIIKDFKKRYPDLAMTQLGEKVVIHINDTHPALAIPELMRILMDQEHLSFEDAWNTTRATFAYTNHTVMSEALEKWPVAIYRELLPRIYDITVALNEHYCQQLSAAFPGQWQRISDMAIIAYDQVRMANLAIALSFSVNGVSQQHAQILKSDVFANFNALEPDKFIGITNGITYRRWLMKANPGLARLITDAIGPKWKKDLAYLEDLAPYADDAAFREKFAAVKLQNKQRMAQWIRRNMEIDVDPGAIFDCQAKRLHEYKRQLLNVLRILHLYNTLLAHPNLDMPKRVFLFAAKASPGYTRAKLIIRLINAAADLINKTPQVRDKIQVVFLPNYCVSLAEVLIPSADISEQISTAGKEASGTGNMKFMLNGALTLGTLDGANVEIAQQVGMDNIYIFGGTAEQNADLYRTGAYHASDLYMQNPQLKAAVDLLIDERMPGDRHMQFADLYQSLLSGDPGNIADPYLLLNDFASYLLASEKTDRDYVKPDIWWRKAVLNSAKAGVFSSDRTIGEYNARIWHLSPIRMK
nr:glycogen/starch/alpha-glucan phosphorylase [Maliibacterium massiliense]